MVKIKRKSHHAILQCILQLKSVCSAKHLLQELSERERRLMRDVLHCATKKLAKPKNVTTFVARYTSQKCNRCKHIYKGNRNKSHFRCVRCGHTAHADINAACNICDNHLLSSTPYATVDKVRTSPLVASHQPSVGGI